MRPDTTPPQLSHFLTEELYLLAADKAFYGNAFAAQAPVPDAAPQEPAIVKETPALTFKYLGGNQKKMLVLCHYADAEYMADAHLTALTNTIGRLGYTLNDVAIVNLFNYEDSAWPQLNSFFHPQKLLILGNAACPQGLPKLGQNQMQPLEGLKALYTYSFTEMIGQKENTKTFWTQIQTL
ncbi:hypothetical protein ABDD95_21180 [Mucilaginibacter sp. PAMB04274]|uniref:hypothetical protein n=1 Tax=Mucilaginibacter sp. PAMB04274 TaxID=3138568 RepID=UPI0031F61174